jgi:hypothetical protein
VHTWYYRLGTVNLHAVQRFPPIFDKQRNEVPSLLPENYMAAVNNRLPKENDRQTEKSTAMKVFFLLQKPNKGVSVTAKTIAN